LLVANAVHDYNVLKFHLYHLALLVILPSYHRSRL